MTIQVQILLYMLQDVKKVESRVVRLGMLE